MVAEPRARPRPSTTSKRKPGSCGKAVINVETRVVDDEMRDVLPGEVGEIVHRSPHLMLGYFNDPEKTAAAFSGDWQAPFSGCQDYRDPGSRWAWY